MHPEGLFRDVFLTVSTWEFNTEKCFVPYGKYTGYINILPEQASLLENMPESSLKQNIKEKRESFHLRTCKHYTIGFASYILLSQLYYFHKTANT